MTLLSLLWWVHELAAISWFGEAFFITYVILPAFGKSVRLAESLSNGETLPASLPNGDHYLVG